MKELASIDFQRHKWRISILTGLLVIVVAGSFWLNTAPFRSGFEITDELGGNIFPSSILSVATTDAQVIVPADSLYVGNSKSCISIRIRSGKAYSRVRIEVSETPFFSRSVSEFVLAKPRTEYTIYPDIIWNYEALKNNNQAEPVSVAVKVEMNDKDLGQRVRTFSVRSINECLLGYVTNGTKFHDTGIFFAAYVNEENPMIDKLLREALKHALSIVSWAIRVAMLKWWTSKFMLYGMCFKSVISVTVPFPIPVCPVMWSFPSVFARLMMHWSLRRLTVWMVACCLLPCFVPLI